MMPSLLYAAVQLKQRTCAEVSAFTYVTTLKCHHTTCKASENDKAFYIKRYR